MEKSLILVLCSIVSGCGLISGTSLRCGVDGDSSYVELVNMPQNLSTEVKYYSKLCGFSYEGQDDLARINLVDSAR